MNQGLEEAGVDVNNSRPSVSEMVEAIQAKIGKNSPENESDTGLKP